MMVGRVSGVSNSSSLSTNEEDDEELVSSMSAGNMGVMYEPSAAMWLGCTSRSEVLLCG